MNNPPNKTGRFDGAADHERNLPYIYEAITRQILGAISDGRDYIIQTRTTRIVGISGRTGECRVSLRIVLNDHTQTRPGEITTFSDVKKTGGKWTPPPRTAEVKFDRLDWIAPNGQYAYRRREEQDDNGTK